MSTTKLGGPAFGIEATGLTDLVKAIKRADPEAKKLLLRQLRSAGDVIASAAKANAGWSRRIPGTVKVAMTQKGMSIKAGGAGAPHAAAYERGSDGNAGMIRHQVFGKDVWVETPSRPYLEPAGRANEVALLEAVDLALDAWMTSVGFR